MFSLVPRGSYVDERISRNYGKEVLLANWQERRGGSDEQNDCILPGLKRVNACEEHLSEVKDNYILPWDTDELDDATRQFLNARNESLHNHKKNRATQVRFPLTKEMKNNFTTTYKIMYEIVPQQELKAASVQSNCQVPAKPQHINILQSYGNRSRTGKRCHLRQLEAVERSQRMQTTYAAEFIPRGAFNLQPELN